MNIMIGDTIVTEDKETGIVESREGNFLIVRFPESGNRRDQVPRNQATPLGELVHRARTEGRPLRVGTHISLVGDSTLADLVSLFGYSTGQMRRESLSKVLRQLLRAGLEITSETERWSRDDRFKVNLVGPLRDDDDEADEPLDTDQSRLKKPATNDVSVPDDPFWPRALGLEPPRRELEFLRALTENDPILCLLFLPSDAPVQAWVQGTWEGIVSWAFRAAQRFIRDPTNTDGENQVQVGPVALLHSYLNPSVLGSDRPRLRDQAHTLTLITIKRELDIPTDFERLSAVWPGPVFEFKPDYKGRPTTDIQSINKCLALTAGMPTGEAMDQSPLRILNWATASYARLMTRPITEWGVVVASNDIPTFKGSNEGSSSLALKAHLASWLRKADASVLLQFEYAKDEDEEVDDEIIDEPIARPRKRIDLHVEGTGNFEVESLRGSGPMESFYHRKIFSRVDKRTPFWLIIPNEAILWAGPHLSDIAHYLGEKNGHVMIPSMGGSFLEINGRPLTPLAMEPSLPVETKEPGTPRTADSEVPIRTQDVVGYAEVRRRIIELIIWPETNRRLLRRASRSAGVLFFGPPGCGKSRWAKAIAGELEHEARLLAPSDLRGPFIGWGQIMIREQFDWLAEDGKRMLIIDELDAIARSRHELQMHSDEKACVNELLVQIDRVLGLGRLMVATTNFIGSLDEAVIRSGRFGRFIPVPPPDLNESVDILAYYLKRLDDPSDPDRKLRVHVPERGCLEVLIAPLYSENLQSGRFYCVADLEEAVNRAYSRSARRAMPDGVWSQESGIVAVDLTEEELNRSLNEVPRSVQSNSVKEFIEDVDRFCDRETRESLSTRLGQSNAT